MIQPVERQLTLKNVFLLEVRCGHCLSREMAVQDGVLSDSELNDFQVHCFAVPLQPEELSGVKTVVLKGMPEVSLLPCDVLFTHCSLA